MSQLEHSYFPGWRLGYRCNPSHALTQEELSDVAVLPQALTAKLEDLPTLTQIIAEHGRGKTSSLLALQRHFPYQGTKILNCSSPDQ